MRKSLLSLFIFACATLVSGLAHGEDFPTRPIRFISGSAPGGVADLIPRIISRALNERLGWQTVVENRPGGDYLIANQSVAQARPDGYTVLIAHSWIALMEKLNKDLPYNLLRDMTPITRFGSAQVMLVANPSLPVKNITELVAYSKANPGKVNYGQPRNNQPYFAVEAIKRATGLVAPHVSYKSSGAAVTDVLGGHISLSMTAPANVADMIKDGRLRGLLMLSPTRSALFPEVQSLTDAGLPPSANSDTWFSFFVPAGTPKAIIDRLHKETLAVVQSPEIRAEFAKLNIDPIWDESPEAFRRLVEQELLAWEKIIQDESK